MKTTANSDISEKETIIHDTETPSIDCPECDGGRCATDVQCVWCEGTGAVPSSIYFCWLEM